MDEKAKQEAERRENFRQVNASLALDGLTMSAEDLALQERVICGEITFEQMHEEIQKLVYRR